MNNNLTNKKFFVFDVETNGLYGEAFAVGAVVYENGQEIARFSGIAEANSIDNPWVIENVLPHLGELKNFDSKLEMRNAFWDFWKQHKDGAFCFADVGSPVESNFFRKCIEDDLGGRQWDGPYPLHEVASVLLTKGIDPDVSRTEFTGYEGTPHNPVYDSIASYKTLIKALSL